MCEFRSGGGVFRATGNPPCGQKHKYNLEWPYSGSACPSFLYACRGVPHWDDSPRSRILNLLVKQELSDSYTIKTWQRLSSSSPLPLL